MIKKRLKRFYCIVTAFILALVTVIVGEVNFSLAFAATDIVTAFENQNVLTDLTGATLNGKTFDLADYPFDENGSPQIVSFVEFSYSYYANKQEDYGLYVYVYNPQGLAFDTDTERNKIQLTYGDKTSYSKYVLEFLNYSTQTGYEGLFYKFKVDLSDTERTSILNTVEQSSRVYSVSGIELSVNTTVTDYACAQVYTYSGYALGCGSDLMTESTLTCTVDGLKKYLSLDVHSTYYRPEGTSGEAYTQDILHSVYFSVPNEIISEYGEMTAVHATWLNAYTNPILVTGNSSVYNAILPYVGTAVDGGSFTYAKDDSSPVPYAIIASKYLESASWNNASYGVSYMSYNANREYTNSSVNVETLYYCFLADNGDADSYTLRAETLIGDKEENVTGYFESYTDEHGGELINDRYSSDLFEEVESEFTDITIGNDDTFSLTDEIISQDLWQKYVGGGYNVEATNTYTISAIKKVESSDFKETTAATCENLYIAESDYDDFKTYYDKATKSDETVYLFRYYQSSYTSYECVEYERGSGDRTLSGTNFGYDYVDTNAFFCQMWVQLDFDIIDLTFTKDNVEMVIPVIMSPQDIVADVTPPVITTSSTDSWVQELLRILMLALLCVIIIVLLPYILKLISLVFNICVKVVSLPLKLIKKSPDEVKTRKRKRYK